MKIYVRLFRFDARFDYLPTYKPYSFAFANYPTVREILAQISVADPLFACDISQVEGVRLNGVGTQLDTVISTNEIVIEPLSLVRSVHDLVIDRADFDSKFGLFDGITNASDRQYYNQFFIPYYLSYALEQNPAYQGEAAFMLANRLIERAPSETLSILKLIGDPHNGIFNYCSLAPLITQDASAIENTIKRLQQLVFNAHFAPANAVPAVAFAARTLPELPAELAKLSGKKVALALDCGAFGSLCQNEYANALKAAGGELITIKHHGRFSGASVVGSSPKLALKMASGLLQEAINNGADTLWCASAEVADFLRSQRQLTALAIL